VLALVEMLEDDTIVVLVVEVGVETFWPPDAELSFGIGGKLEILLAFGLRKDSTEAAVFCVIIVLSGTLFLLEEVDLSLSRPPKLELLELEFILDFSLSESGEEVRKFDEDKLLLFSSFREFALDKLEFLDLLDWGMGEFLPLEF